MRGDLEQFQGVWGFWLGQDIIVRGSGTLVDGNERVPFKEDDWMFIPTGVFHQHVNNGNEPMWLIWMYTPPGELPKT